MKRHPSIANLLVLGILLALGPGCMSDPDDYVDPPPAPAVDAATTPDDVLSGDDTATAADVATSDDTAVDPQDGGPADAAPAPEDTAPQEVAQPDEVIEPPEEEVASGPTCPCSFQLAATQPMAQDYVWITGDFLDPAWAGHQDDGALPLTLNAAGDTWQIDVDLPDLTNVEYKYLAGWPDNPGPVWRGPNGESDSDNGYLYVICGQVPCGSGE